MRPVQKGNESWVIEHQVGLMVKHPHQIVNAISELLALSTCRENSKKHSHQAVFEVSNLLTQSRDPFVNSVHTLKN